MKSLYITNLGILEPLGQTQIIPYLKGLSENGIKICLLSFEKKYNLANLDRVALQNEELRSFNIHWVHLKYHHRWGNLADLLSGFFIAGFLILKKKINVIHARASIPAIIGLLTSKIFSIRFVYDRRGTMVGDFVDDVNEENIFKYRIFAKLLDKLEQKILLSADAVIVLSEIMADILKKSGLNKDGKKSIAVIPCCVDLTKFNINLNRDEDLLKKYGLENKFIFIYLGSLGTCYKFDEMLNFFRVAKRQIDNAHFLILTQTDRRLAEEPIARSNLNLIDFTILSVEPEDVSKYIALSNIALIFIKQTFSNLASCPTKVAECLACGIPVIVNSMMGDIEAIVNENRIGIVVENFSESEYKIKIKECLEIIGQSRDLAQRCFQAASEKLSLKMGIDRYREVYNRIASLR